MEFAAAFAAPPVIVLSITGFSLSNGGAVKTVVLRAEEVGGQGFTLVVEGARLESITASWLAYGD